MASIQPGSVDLSDSLPGDWVIADLGFSARGKSCGLAVGSETPQTMTFADLKARLTQLLARPGRPMRLVLEAPLSVAFSDAGNPAGRAIERRGEKTRYWYVGLGCTVLVAATYLLRHIHQSPRARDLVLYEGFVSFKPDGQTSHIADVLALKAIVTNSADARGRIIGPDGLRFHETDRVISAFLVADMDFGVPPVVFVEPEGQEMTAP